MAGVVGERPSRMPARLVGRRAGMERRNGHAPVPDEGAMVDEHGRPPGVPSRGGTGSPQPPADPGRFAAANTEPAPPHVHPATDSGQAHRTQPTTGGDRHMTTAREIMTAGAECIGADDTVSEAARKMTRMRVGALPICGSDNKLKGMLTDRDIVVKVLGQGKDPALCKAGELAQGEAVTIGADDDAEEILRTMREHKVRRLPVIDGHQLVGMVAQADVARALPNPKVGDLLEALSSD